MKSIDKLDRFKKFRSKRTSRKEKRLKKKSRPQWRKSFSILKYLVILSLIISTYLLLFFKTKYWDGEGKLSVVINNPSGDIKIVTFDPKVGEVSQITIPAETQVEVARGRGSWKIKSIWKLGEEEKLGGLLLAETLTHHMKIPVYVWADAPGEGLAEKDIFKVLKATLSPYKTNMGLGDKVKIALFNISVKSNDRRSINLAETAYLRQGELSDGETGYYISGKYPSELLAIFSDEEVSQKSLQVSISNYSGNSDVANSLGEVIEILGAKVASIKNEEKMGIDCEVSGNSLLTEKIISLFKCKKGDEVENVFDVSLKIGEIFAKRF